MSFLGTVRLKQSSDPAIVATAVLPTISGVRRQIGEISAFVGPRLYSDRRIQGKNIMSTCF
jgi:hypothetical protein